MNHYNTNANNFHTELHSEEHIDMSINMRQSCRHGNIEKNNSLQNDQV